MICACLTMRLLFATRLFIHTGDASASGHIISVLFRRASDLKIKAASMPIIPEFKEIWNIYLGTKILSVLNSAPLVNRDCGDHSGCIQLVHNGFLFLPFG